MYFELDGTFPNHEANPLDPKNLVDLQAKVREVGADIGLAFDGDADRCFVIDERGDPVSPSAVTALVAVRELAKEPGAHGDPQRDHLARRAGDRRASTAAPVRTRVGHSYIKPEMARTGAIFGGEHSAHYYFRDFWRADTGMLAALHVLAALGVAGPPAVAARRRVRAVRRVGRDQQHGRRPARVASRRSRPPTRIEPGVEIDELDGLTVVRRRLVVQRARLEHRAVAAAQRRGARTARPWHACATRCSAAIA